jgi:MbtH protein
VVDHGNDRRGLRAAEPRATIEAMMHEHDIYLVVVNHEEQYSIWPADRPLPRGWRAEGTQGDRARCLDHIERVWTDMRPLSLR